MDRYTDEYLVKRKPGTIAQKMRLLNRWLPSLGDKPVASARVGQPHARARDFAYYAISEQCPVQFDTCRASQTDSQIKQLRVLLRRARSMSFSLFTRYQSSPFGPIVLPEPIAKSNGWVFLFVVFSLLRALTNRSRTGSLILPCRRCRTFSPEVRHNLDPTRKRPQKSSSAQMYPDRCQNKKNARFPFRVSKYL